MFTVSQQFSVFLMVTVTLKFSPPYGPCHTSVFSVPSSHSLYALTPLCRGNERVLFSYVVCSTIIVLWSTKIQLFIWICETLFPVKVVSLVKHTLLLAFLPFVVTFLENILWNYVQLVCRVPHNVFS